MVSIIIPIYNCAHNLKRCITSVQRQTYQDLEIILIDDGSTDSSGNLCDEFAEKDKRIRVIHKKNGGPSSARNLGIEIASGKYIQFVDSDDYIAEDMTQNLVDSLERNQTSCAICGFLWIIDEIKSPKRLKDYGAIEISKLYEKCAKIFSNSIINPPWNKLYVREKIEGRFDEELSLGEDLLFNLDYLDKIDIVSFVEGTPYFYMDSQKGLSKKFQEDNFDVAEKLYNASKQFVLKHQMGKDAVADVTYIFVKSNIYGCYDVCSTNKLSKWEKKEKISEHLKKDSVQQAIRNVKLENYQQRLAAKLMKRQWSEMLILFCRLKQLVSIMKERYKMRIR